MVDYDRAKPQIHEEGDREASLGCLADQGAGRAGIRPATSDLAAFVAHIKLTVVLRLIHTALYNPPKSA